MQPKVIWMKYYKCFWNNIHKKSWNIRRCVLISCWWAACHSASYSFKVAFATLPLSNKHRWTAKAPRFHSAVNISMSTEAFECCIGREEKAQMNYQGDLSSHATVPKNSSYCDGKSEETQKKTVLVNGWKGPAGRIFAVIWAEETWMWLDSVSEREIKRVCASEWMRARYLAPLWAPNASWDILCGTFWRLCN